MHKRCLDLQKVIHLKKRIIMIGLFDRFQKGLEIITQTLQLFANHPTMFVLIGAITALKIALVVLLAPGILYGTELLTFVVLQVKPNHYNGDLSSLQTTTLFALIATVLMLFPFVNACIALFWARYCAPVLRNQKPSVLGSLGYALRRMPGACLWVIVNCIVGLMVGMIRGSTKQNQNPTILDAARGMLANIAGLTWSALTFLTLPIMALGNKGVIEGIKESYRLMKKTYGESATGAVGLSVMRFLVGLLTFSLLGLAVMHASWQPIAAANHYKVILNPWAVGGALIVMLVLNEMLRAVSMVLRTAVYLYATDTQVHGLDKNILEQK
jgi:hypothetical protein